MWPGCGVEDTYQFGNNIEGKIVRRRRNSEAFS